MNTRAFNPQPRPGAVFREQLDTVFARTRKESFLLAFLSLAVCVGISLSVTLEGGAEELDLMPADAMILIVLAALLAPHVVWKAEELRRRTYLFAMPVNRRTNQLMRLLAGWVWLMSAIGFFAVCVLVVNRFSGAALGVDTIPIFAEEAGQPASPGDFYQIVIHAPWWQWLMPFVGATTAYLLMSALVIGTNHPVPWVIAIWVFVVSLGIVSEILSWTEVSQFLENLLSERGIWYSPLTGFFGSVPSLETIPGRADPVWITRPNVSGFLASTALWMGIGIAGTSLALVRHRES